MDTAFRIVDYTPEHQAAFEALNRAWIERHFTLEPADLDALQDPEHHILEPGGVILVAVAEDRVVGTAALLRHGREFEVAKMAVADGWRGRGVGKALMLALIDRFRAIGGDRLFLETNAGLAPALRLYESTGFVRIGERRPGSPYARANVYMEYRP
jgi:ribosomal protein S18 acetylase RimI-like enzyme